MNATRLKVVLVPRVSRPPREPLPGQGTDKCSSDPDGGFEHSSRTDATSTRRSHLNRSRAMASSAVLVALDKQAESCDETSADAELARETRSLSPKPDQARYLSPEATPVSTRERTDDSCRDPAGAAAMKPAHRSHNPTAQ